MHTMWLPDIRGLSCSYYDVENIDDANGALGVTFRAVAKPGVAFEL
jgi:hypothetical protein